MLLVLAACGDGNKQMMPDGSSEPTPDATPDTMDPPQQQTFTQYVIEMVTTQTNATAAPRTYSEFASLIDPDAASNNLAAYATLF